MIDTAVTLLFGAALAILLYVRSNTILVYFQQEEYDSTRFFSAWRDVRLFDVLASVSVVVALLAGWLVSMQTPLWSMVSLVFLAIAWREKSYRYKKPLVVTERLLRIRRLVWLCLALLLMVVMLYKPLTLVLLHLVPLIIMAANALLVPAQTRINNGFIEQARSRIKESKAHRIGITGSFGKTTVKHILAELLEVSGPVFFSKGSVNTELGLTRHIRQRLQPAHEYFIAEMGAYQLGSINRLCKFVEPDFGMVTAVGEAHAERFGSIETTARAKSELAEWICSHGKVVVVTEDVMKNEPFAVLKKAHPEKFVVVGHSDSCDVSIKRSVLQGGHWHIDLTLPGAIDFSYRIPLMGDHNIMNSALCVALVNAIDPQITPQLPAATKSLEQVAHRLELKEFPGQPAILDDAYNSNEKGFINAVDVLKQLADERGGRAVLVTPGIAELGQEHDEVHRRLGEYCKDRCDHIFVVNPDRIATFVQAAGGASATLEVVASLDVARQQLAQLELTPDDIVLYENDLPDLLEEHRLL